MNALPEGGRSLAELRRSSTESLALQLLECSYDAQMHNRCWVMHTAAVDPARHNGHPSMVLRACSVQLPPKPGLQSVCRPCVEFKGPSMVATHLCITSAHHPCTPGAKSLRCDALPWGRCACFDVQGSRESLQSPPCHCDCRCSGNLRPSPPAWTRLQVETSPSSTASCGDSEPCRPHHSTVGRLVASAAVQEASAHCQVLSGACRRHRSTGSRRSALLRRRRRPTTHTVVAAAAQGAATATPAASLGICLATARTRQATGSCPSGVEFDRSCKDRMSKRLSLEKDCVIGHKGVHCR